LLDKERGHSSWLTKVILVEECPLLIQFSKH
jgi:hypothetical protein